MTPVVSCSENPAALQQLAIESLLLRAAHDAPKKKVCRQLLLSAANVRYSSVRPEMYASDWIFSVFTSVLPEKNSKVTSKFFSLFLEHKWEFFYKLILTILKHSQAKILAHDDMFSILQEVKVTMSSKNDPMNYANQAKPLIV